MHKIITTYLFLFFFGITIIIAQHNFVKRTQNNFAINNKPYYFIGCNMWYANIFAMAGNKGGDRKRLIKELDFLKQQGINNLRILIGAQGQGKLVNAVDPVHPAMQTAPAVYNEATLEGMDYLLQQLNKRKMYGVFFFSNNWEWSGGFLQYMNWHNKIDDNTMAKKFTWDENRNITSQFYSCTECMDDYYAFVKMVLDRTNKITGKKYIDDPAIMAWEIANEPRPMRPYAIEGYKKFLLAATAIIKNADKNHLVTLGAEGYMGTENMQVFEEIHASKNVDYATIHIWPKNWSWFSDSSFKNDFKNVVSKTAAYINEHAAVMQKINKPLVIEEFGLPRDNFSFALNTPVSYRNKYFEGILKLLIKSKKENKAISGINFWALAGFGKPAKNKDPFWKEGDDLLGDPPMEEQGLNSVFASDSSTWNLLRKYVALLKK